MQCLLSFALGHFSSFDGITRPLNFSIKKRSKSKCVKLSCSNAIISILFSQFSKAKVHLVEFLPEVKNRAKFIGPDVLVKLCGLDIGSLEHTELADDIDTNHSLRGSLYVLRQTEVAWFVELRQTLNGINETLQGHTEVTINSILFYSRTSCNIQIHTYADSFVLTEVILNKNSTVASDNKKVDIQRFQPELPECGQVFPINANNAANKKNVM